MNYIDSFIAAVPNDNKETYIEHAKLAGAVFIEHGAISVVDCWGDQVPSGENTSFPKAVMCKENETVVLSWIAWPSKVAREIGMQKVMEDSRMQSEDMPFDGSRMIFGSFQTILESCAYTRNCSIEGKKNSATRIADP